MIANILNKLFKKRELLCPKAILPTECNLREVIALMTAEYDVRRLLQLIIRCGVELLDMESGGVVLWDEEKKVFTLNTVLGMPAPVVGLVIKPGEGITSRVIEIGSTEVIDNYSKFPGAEKMLKGLGYTAIIGAPIRWKDKIIGVIHLNTKQPKRRFTREDKDTLETLAIHAAVAIRNAQMYEELNAKIKLLQEAQDKLIKTERLATMGSLAGSIGHELRNPLSVIRNVAYFLRTKLKEKDEKILKHIDVLEHEVIEADRIINNILGFARTKELTPKEIDINWLIKNVLYANPLPKNISITTQLSADLPRIIGDESQLTQVFINLTSNAQDAMETSGGNLSVKTQLTEDSVEVEFADSGCGISAENLKKIFNPLFSTKQRGVGFGLAICKSFVEAHKGTIDITSQLNKGTTVTIKLPISQ